MSFLINQAEFSIRFKLSNSLEVNLSNGKHLGYIYLPSFEDSLYSLRENE